MVDVSMVMPVHNGMPYLAEALDGIATQTLAMELIVVDDGSSDDSAQVARRAGATVVATPHLGVAAAINLGVTHASGRYIARHDADDVSTPTRLQEQFRFLEDNPAISAVGITSVVIDEDSDAIGRPADGWPHAHHPCTPEEISAMLPGRNPMIGGSVMLRRDALERVGGYRPAFRYASDYDLWLRLDEVGELANLPGGQYRLRRHAKSMWGARGATASVYAVLARHLAAQRRSGGADSLARLGEAEVRDRIAGVVRRVDATGDRTGVVDEVRNLLPELV
ncbi:hypothetical protein BIV57_00345 [Mangrovactinospora gilvigrisea]|uniref:Glycosyltransferase 2-like domain-containing protein n=1 Tax=Mangrovactinospora gilvigrisea TaxID=1428644 RepID=A0A1J7BL73_9ACTN|nr:glycosyltransferase [Mangrovactinospora gilvigrisea]OIV39333.1 hypothetical protein BIV57_00345 [Mangrovactinospora gilvigrisea]